MPGPDRLDGAFCLTALLVIAGPLGGNGYCSAHGVLAGAATVKCSRIYPTPSTSLATLIAARRRAQGTLQADPGKGCLVAEAQPQMLFG